MRTTLFMLSTSALFALACGDADRDGSLYDRLATDEDLTSDEGRAEVLEGEVLPPLECPHGGSVGAVRVTFDCDEVIITSCKDLSNVVIELEDGSRQRFEGLKGHQQTFAATGAQRGAAITTVWVKAGANHSGDGPGYGERFDAPAEACLPPTQPPEECGGIEVDCTPGTPRDPFEPPIGI